MNNLIPASVSAAVATRDPAADRAIFDRQWGVLRAAVAGPQPAALRNWAAELAVQGDALPLLGTGLRGPRYESMLWNGARCAEAAVLITGLLTAAPGVAVDDLAAAVAAGVRCNGVLRELVSPGPIRAGLDTIGCAITAARLAAAAIDPDTTIDLAASLLVFESASARSGATRTDLVRAGHPVAAAWLATRLLVAGFTPMRGALAATLTVVTGPAPDPGATVADLLEALPTAS